jgi:RNA ligase
MTLLLTRDQFREGVFERDGHKCIVCKEPAQDAHHIIERRLFDDSGYYLDNGASVCGKHHMEAEQTVLSCDKIRELAGIKRIVLPDHLYPDQPYDKWGNPILPNGTRVRGELMEDASVRKVLSEGGVFPSQFTWRMKYPRTYHLPWSPGANDDDRVLKSDELFRNEPVVVTLKMDGENTTMYQDYIHARSLDFQSQDDRDWVKATWARIAGDIPNHWRVCGENLFAKHTIKYEALPSYFMLFSVWDQRNECLSWEETQEWAELFGVQTVPVIYQDIYCKPLIEKAFEPHLKTHEGYVVRRFGSFHYSQFRHCVAKYVRAGHVPEHGLHWRRRMIEKNGLVTGARP